MNKLILVPTPIGNLEDITIRAINILKQADLILAEDTRHTATLLRHYDIKASMQSHHSFNEHKTVQHVADKIFSGLKVVLVTDAGTPGISDPGFLLVRHCISQGIEVECLPGATALIPALVCSGFPCDRFVFEGFLPHKKGRSTRLQLMAAESRTTVFYESPHRLVKVMEQLIPFCGSERMVCVARELTKLHEELFRGSLTQAIKHFSAKDVKGEIVIVLAGADHKEKEQTETDTETDTEDDN